jgi:hypothetical protein
MGKNINNEPFRLYAWVLTDVEALDPPLIYPWNREQVSPGGSGYAANTTNKPSLCRAGLPPPSTTTAQCHWGPDSDSASPLAEIRVPPIPSMFAF